MSLSNVYSKQLKFCVLKKRKICADKKVRAEKYLHKSAVRFDIITKIVKNLYAEFLPEATSVLLCNDIPVGFCFMNLTGGTIANIPIVAIKKEHQGKGLSKYMLKRSIEQLLRWVDAGEKPITEVNTCTETNNFQALKMYRHLGFKEDYNYPQSYLPVRK